MGERAGRVALVTGGGRGVGLAIGAALGASGYAVALAGRSPEPLQRAAAQIAAGGGRALALPCDVADSRAVAQLVADVAAQLGPVDVLVNNAGVTASLRLSDTDDATWDRIMRVNVSGPFYCCRAALPGMLERGWGRIINIASIAALGGMAFSSAYSASKHALLGLTRSLALEVGQRGVTANALCPGWVETDMLAEAIENIVQKTGRTREQARASLLALAGQQRAVTPEEVAAAAMRLVGPAGAGVNGEAIRIM